MDDRLRSKVNTQKAREHTSEFLDTSLQTTLRETQLAAANMNTNTNTTASTVNRNTRSANATTELFTSQSRGDAANNNTTGSSF